jgi:hypothetical protein
VPAGVRDVIGRRMSRLPEAANRLLAVGALSEVALDLPVAARVAELDEARRTRRHRRRHRGGDRPAHVGVRPLPVHPRALPPRPRGGDEPESPGARPPSRSRDAMEDAARRPGSHPPTLRHCSATTSAAPPSPAPTGVWRTPSPSPTTRPAGSPSTRSAPRWREGHRPPARRRRSAPRPASCDAPASWSRPRRRPTRRSLRPTAALAVVRAQDGPEEEFTLLGRLVLDAFGGGEVEAAWGIARLCRPVGAGLIGRTPLRPWSATRCSENRITSVH